jgi:amino acid permease
MSVSRSRGILCVLLLLLPTAFVTASLSPSNHRHPRRKLPAATTSRPSLLIPRGGATLPPPPPRPIATVIGSPISTSSSNPATAIHTNKNQHRNDNDNDNNDTNDNNDNDNNDDSVIPAGDASIPNEVFNVIKSIVGAGVLGLPAGIASFGNAPTAVVPAMILLVAIGYLSATGFSLIGIVCAKTNARSYRQAWSRSVSEKTAWMPATACLLVTFCSVLCYSMILADTVPSVLRTLTGNAVSISRTAALLGVTTLVLTPLCLLKDLKSLAPFSLVGILGMLYTATAMTVRYLTGSYSANTATAAADTGANVLLDNLADNMRPAFGTAGYKSVFSSNSAILVSMLSTAYMAHYNAPKFYWELRNHSVERYNTVVRYSFTGAIFLMAVTAATGFLTFGGACNSLILNNYAASDSLMSLSRFAVTVSLCSSYPLAFVGVRDGLLDLCKVPTAKRNGKLFNPLLTLGLLSVITVGAHNLKDIGIILALGGATWGNFVIYLAPAFMVLSAARQEKYRSELRPLVPRAMTIGIIGLGLGLIGTERFLRKLYQ